jgi:nucleotide-binding universal stress UspA family protein
MGSPTVVVGTDGSPGATAAVTAAAEYARLVGAGLVLVTVWDWPMLYGTAVLVDAFDPQAAAQALAEQAAAAVPLPPASVTIDVRQGHAGRALVEASLDARLLVVGRRGHGAIAEALLGSVSNYCVHHATVPVLVVPDVSSR